MPTVVVPGLYISASASPDPVRAGELLTYTFDYGNLGTVDVSGTVIAATVPVNTTFVSAAAGGTLSGSTLSWTIGSLATGASGSVQLVVQTDPLLPDGTTITNESYSIDSNETASAGGAAVSTIVTLAPFLRVSKTHIPEPVRAGDFMTYRITCSNLGNATATRVVITDFLPQHTSFVWATDGGTHANGTVTWILDMLPPGSTDAVHEIVRVSSQLPGGSLVTSDRYTIIANGILPVTGTPDMVTVVAASPPMVLGAIEEITGSNYIIMAGRHSVQIVGIGFRDGAIVDLGPDITIGATTWVSPSRLDIPIEVDDEASPGPRGLTVTNPDLASANLVDAFVVVRSPDLNGNCVLEGSEFNVLAGAFNTTRGEPGFVEAADLDGDDAVGPADLAIFLRYSGKAFPACP